MTETIGWDKVYSERYMTIWEPHDALVQFVARFLKKRLRYDSYQIHRDVCRVLDLGCGNGAQSLFLSKANYEVYGIDISKEAIRLAEEFAMQEGQSISFGVYDCEELPFEDNFFDVVVSNGVLDHVLAEKASSAIREVMRVLKHGGLFWFSLASVQSSLFGDGIRRDRHTYEISDGFEKGEIQRYFDVEDLRELLPDNCFRLLDVRHAFEERFILAQNERSSISSDGRWFLTCEIIKES